MSNIPQASGSFSNLVTQISTGYSTRNEADTTSFWLSYQNAKDYYDARDYAGLGQYIQLFLSQLVKYQAPQVKQDVTFTN